MTHKRGPYDHEFEAGTIPRDTADSTRHEEYARWLAGGGVANPLTKLSDERLSDDSKRCVGDVFVCASYLMDGIGIDDKGKRVSERLRENAEMIELVERELVERELERRSKQ